MVLAKLRTGIRRRRVMLKFRSFDIKYRARILGEALAKPEDAHRRKHLRESLHDAVHQVCKDKNIRHDDLQLVETDLNDYINGLVTRAYEKEAQREKEREFVDTRIKIKGGDKLAESGSEPLSEY